jgi:alpha-ketoglutarate-dependent taurine dioxygenase
MSDGMSQPSIRGTRQRRAIDISSSDVVEVKPFGDGPLDPWLVAPKGEVDLVSWAGSGSAEVERLVLDRGAVLFRGFGLKTAEQFERVAAALTSDLYGGYGDLPREGESPNVYQSTPYPADQPILFHSESSHLARWPTRISFFCITPAAEGGETPLADTRAIAQRLDPDVLSEFKAKGLRYVRNFSGLDVSWQQFFQTDDRTAVERRCLEDGANFAWTRDGGQLRVSQPAAAVRDHPVTGDQLFFNQIQLHHPYFLPEGARDALLALVEDPADLPRNVTFGDDSPISDEIAAHVLDVYWKTCVMFPWQAGDIILLDNMRVAHARMPFKGSRRVAVAMAGMTGA